MRTGRCRAAVAAFLVALLTAACSSAVEEDPRLVETFSEHMHGHLDHVSAIKAGVIAGDIDATREHSVWLSEHDEPPGMPVAWTPYVREMRQYAAVAAAARDLETIAVAISELARTCGECHYANAVDLGFGFHERPTTAEEDLRTQMQRHLWAADRMWEGLLGPSDRAWRWGAQMLAEVKLTPAQVDSAPANEAEVGELVQRVKALAAQGSRTSYGPDRSKLYGKFLTQCSSCHRLTGGGPSKMSALAGRQR